jgi:hypothetical protein
MKSASGITSLSESHDAAAGPPSDSLNFNVKFNVNSLMKLLPGPEEPRSLGLNVRSGLVVKKRKCDSKLRSDDEADSKLCPDDEAEGGCIVSDRPIIIG